MFSEVVPTDGWLPYPVTSRCLHDAFAGPMPSLPEPIGTGRPPATAARDSVRTLELVHALWTSTDSGQTVTVQYA